jgi:pimeloyl-ACP methyl ester carboxylesterase
METYFPSDKGSTIQLGNGRNIGYMEYGNIESQNVVLMFPGLPGSRLFNPLVAKPELFMTYNIRMIVMERPGLGLSTANPNKTILNWADDVKEFLDTLHIPLVSVIGYSAGGYYNLM